VKKFNPSKIVCVGLNYKDHAEELKMAIPERPVLFMKPSTSVIQDGDNIVYPSQVKELHYEAELAIVVGKKVKNISANDVQEYIEGYTCANDITARDQQREDSQWTRAKSYDTFSPIGPKIVKDIDPNNLNIKAYVNGKVRQSSSTSNMIFKVEELVSYISNIMTLLPGDVIITGTPPGVGELKRGDMVEVEIEDIGKLKNKVV